MSPSRLSPPGLFALALVVFGCTLPEPEPLPPPGTPDAQSTSVRSTAPIDGIPADGEASADIEIVVRDADGEPLERRGVFLSTDAAGVRFEQPAATDSTGFARGRVRSTTAGRVSVRVSIAMPQGTPAIERTVDVRFFAGPVVQLVVEHELADVQAGAVLAALRVRAVDAHGNSTRHGTEASVALAGDATGLSGTLTQALVDGEATFDDLRIEAAGTHQVVVRAGEMEARTGLFRVTGGEPARLQWLVPPRRTAAGDVLLPAPAVALVDAFGNPAAVDGVPVSLEAEAQDVTLVGPTSAVTQAGVATFTGVSISKTGAHRLVATTEGLEPATTATFDVVPGRLDRRFSTLTITPAEAIADGLNVVSIAGLALDSHGNPAAQANWTLQATQGGCVFVPEGGRTNASGAFSATMTCTRAGPTLISALIGSDRIDAPVILKAGTPAAARSTLTAQPASAVANGQASIVLSAQVRDAQGNAAAGLPVRLELDGAAQTVGSAPPTTDADGRWQVSLRSTVAGQVRASLYAGTTRLDRTVTFVPGSVQRVELEDVPAVAIASRPLPTSPTVRAYDAFDNLVTVDGTAQLTTHDPNALDAIGGTTSLSLVTGEARFDSITLSRRGAFPLHANVTGYGPTVDRTVYVAPAGWFTGNGTLGGVPLALTASQSNGYSLLLTDRGLFRTDDAGDSWRAVEAMLPSDRPLRALIADVYVEDTFHLLAADRIHTSYDAGRTWSPGATVPRASGLHHFASGDGLWFVPTATGLKRSIDGATFTTVLAGDVSAFVAGLRCFAVIGGALHVSEDDGETWDEAALPQVSGRTPVVTGLTRAPHEPGRVWLATDAGVLQPAGDGWTLALATPGDAAREVAFTGPGRSVALARVGAKLWRSDDGGLEWEQVTVPAGFATATLAVEATGSGRVYGFADGLFESADAGRTWTRRYAGPSTTRSIAFGAHPATALATDAEGLVWLTSDAGEHWTRLGLSNTATNTVVVASPSDPDVIYAGPIATGPSSFAMLRFNNADQTFRTLSTSAALRPLAVEPGSTQTLVAVDPNGRLWRSNDGAASFQQLGTDLPATPRAVVFTSTGLVAVTASGLFELGSRGVWQQIPGVAQPTALLADGDRWLALGDNGRSVRRSVDGGFTWADDMAGLPLATDPAARVLSLVRSGETSFVLVSGHGVFRRGAGGWTLAAAGQAASAATGLAAHATGPGLAAFSSEGVLFSYERP